mgnify:FL=1
MRVLRRVAAGFLIAATVLVGACSSGRTAAPGPRVTAPEGKHDLTKADLDAWLDGKIPAALNDGKIPGAIVTVVHDGQVVTNRGYGYADTGADGGEPKPVDAERTLFRPGSISKIPTSIAVMQLVEQGKLDLDADISTYVDVKIDRRFPGNITLRHLLTHTAGFEERYGGVLFAPERGEDLAGIVTTDPPVQVFAPGTTPAYSNYGMALAGHIVQQVSGERFEEYIQRHIFEPLGMDSSTFEQPLPAGLEDRLARGYKTTDGPSSAFTAAAAPEGGMTTSGPDMATFMIAQLERSPKLLQESTWEQMWSPGLGAESLGNLSKASFMGLGYYDESRQGHRIIGHGGDLPSYHSMFHIYPDEGTGVFISLNGDGEGDGTVTSIIRSDLMAGFADRYYPGDENQPRVSRDEAKHHAQQVAGTYITTRTSFTTWMMPWLMMGSTAVTALDNGHLMVGKDEYVMVEPWVWQKTDGSTRIAAQVEDGKVVRIGATVRSFIPQTPAQQALLPVLVGSSLVLLLVIVAWPIGALRRRWAIRDGRQAADPLPRAGRMARIGAVLAIGAVAGWLALVLTLNVTALPTPGVVRPVQALQWLGVAAIIPAILDLFGAVKRRAGWRRIVMASLLLIGLAGMAWWAWTGNALSWDISI